MNLLAKTGSTVRPELRAWAANRRGHPPQEVRQRDDTVRDTLRT